MNKFLNIKMLNLSQRNEHFANKNSNLIFKHLDDIKNKFNMLEKMP